jgi:hypothetical protein
MYMITSHDHDYWDNVYRQIQHALPPEPGKKEKMYDKFIEVHKFPNGASALELYRRGSMHVLHKTVSRGDLKIEEEGLRFIPMTTIPPGYASQQVFESIYWYNLLMRELYIPYSEIKSIRQKYYFKMKDGSKYGVVSLPLIKWKHTVREIKAKISN